jgi:hypothetical protein
VQDSLPEKKKHTEIKAVGAAKCHLPLGELCKTKNLARHILRTWLEDARSTDFFANLNAQLALWLHEMTAKNQHQVKVEGFRPKMFYIFLGKLFRRELMYWALSAQSLPRHSSRNPTMLKTGQRCEQVQ